MFIVSNPLRRRFVTVKPVSWDLRFVERNVRPTKSIPSSLATRSMPPR